MKTAFITGAARGLGKEIARKLGGDGHALFLVDILAQELAHTAEELRLAGFVVHAHNADLSNRESCVAAVRSCVAQTGNLSVLVNCAGILLAEHFADITGDAWNQVLAVNLSAPFFLMQAALPHLVESGGNIINVASASGLIGHAGVAAYAASKAGLISLTKSLAMEYLDRPVRVNAICPGGMETEMGAAPADPSLKLLDVYHYAGHRGMSRPQEVAAVAAFLASDAAASVHGAIWTVDQGLSAG